MQTAETLTLDIEALHRQGVEAAQHALYDVAIAAFREVTAREPDYKDVRYDLIGIASLRSRMLIERGLLMQATARFLDVLDEVGPDHRVRLLAAHFLMTLSAQWRTTNRENFIELAHRAASMLPEDPGVRTYLENALVASGTPARLSDFAPDIEPSDLGTHMLIACFPKSASTYLKNALVALTGYRSGNLAYAYFQNEQDLYLPYMLDLARDDAVIQQHCRASEPNLHILQGFAIRPVVLVRNIFDVLLSWKEFLDQGAFLNTFHPRWAELPDDARLDAVIADRSPWYLSFFAGWTDAIAAGKADGMWMTYEALTAEPEDALARITAFYGIETSQPAITRALQTIGGGQTQNRLNKGVAGRGIDAFSPAQKDRIRALAETYSGVDFARVGL